MQVVAAWIGPLRFWELNLGRSMIFCRVWGFLIERILLWLQNFQFMEFCSHYNMNMIPNPWCETCATLSSTFLNCHVVTWGWRTLDGLLLGNRVLAFVPCLFVSLSSLCLFWNNALHTEDQQQCLFIKRLWWLPVQDAPKESSSFSKRERDRGEAFLFLLL